MQPLTQQIYQTAFTSNKNHLTLSINLSIYQLYILYNSMRSSSVPLLQRITNTNLLQLNLKQTTIPLQKQNHQLIKSFNQKQHQTSSNHSKTQRKNQPVEMKHLKKLRKFAKKDQTTESYSKEFTSLRKSSFLLNNRLTKSVFDISDAAMIGKPQSLNTFRSMHNAGTQNAIPSLKSAAKLLTNNKPIKLDLKKSYIPRVYQKSLSLGDFSLTKNVKLDISIEKDRTFFPTTALQDTQTFVKQSFEKLNKKRNLSTQSISKKTKFQLLYKQKTLQTARLSTPRSQVKIRKIDLKISELKRHNESMQSLIPAPIVKPQKIIIKGKGEIVSQDKIIRVIDKLLSIIELYFQMHNQSGIRVMAFVKNIEGFQNKKIFEIFCQKDAVKHIKSADEIKNYFWIFRSQNLTKDESSGQKFILPQFFGEEDYALYKLLNNFGLKLESKYENHHKQKYKKVNQTTAKRESKNFNNLYSLTNQTADNFQPQQASNKVKSIMSISSNQHVNRKVFLQKIKFHPIKNDKNLFNEIEGLEDLGVKFDFKQKGRSLILAQRSSILNSER